MEAGQPCPTGARDDAGMPALPDQLLLGDDLRAFVDASPSPSHAVAELARRLRAAGFSELAEADAWSLAPGGAYFVVRPGSLIAFRGGSAPLAEAGVGGGWGGPGSPPRKSEPGAG